MVALVRLAEVYSMEMSVGSCRSSQVMNPARRATLITVQAERHGVFLQVMPSCGLRTSIILFGVWMSYLRLL